MTRLLDCVDISSHARSLCLHENLPPLRLRGMLRNRSGVFTLTPYWGTGHAFDRRNDGIRGKTATTCRDMREAERLAG